MCDLEAASCVVGGTLSWCETERGQQTPLAPATPHLAPEAHLLEGLLLPFRNQMQSRLYCGSSAVLGTNTGINS